MCSLSGLMPCKRSFAVSTPATPIKGTRFSGTTPPYSESESCFLYRADVGSKPLLIANDRRRFKVKIILFAAWSHSAKFMLVSLPCVRRIPW